VVGALVTIALHVAATHHFLPLDQVFRDRFLQGGDYDTHIGQTLRVLEALTGWGKTWAYDVKLVAGQPEGTIFDADNKGWEAWTYLGTLLGATPARAFNSFVLLAMLGCPLVVFASARLFGLGAGASVLAAAMGSTIWFFDSFCHWAWWIGMLEYAFASYFALLPLALFYRFVEHGSWRAGAVCALVNAAAHLNHPYTFFMLVVPMAALYLRAFRRLGPRGHAGVVMIGVVTIAVNLVWLVPAIAHWHYILDSAFYGATGPSYLLADFLGVLLDGDDSGVIGTRAGFRFLYLALALAGLVVLRHRRDPRALPLASALLTLVVLGYFAVLIPGSGQIQPYRHVLPLSFFVTLPAAVFCEYLWRERALSGLARPVQVVLAIAALVALQHLAGQALYFLPKLLPVPGTTIHGDPSPMSAYGFPTPSQKHAHLHYGLPHVAWSEAEVDDVVDWVAENVPPGSRVLVETMTLGERIAWKTDVEVMGGFRERNLQHALANLFRRFGPRPVRDAELVHYLRTYAIGWIITFNKRKDFEKSRVISRLPSVGNWNLYRTRAAVSPFLQGRGRVRARTNRIDVQASPEHQDLVLSYHWHEALRCTPRCKVERFKIHRDPVGLIRIPAPHPASFTIYNGYD
jgi:hypothetical protein